MLGLLRKKLLGNVAIVRDEGTDPLDQLKRLLALHVRLIFEYQALPRLIFSGDIYDGYPARKKEIYKIVRTYPGKVAVIILEDQRRGRINPNLEPDILSVVFLGLIQPTAILWHLSDGELDVGKQVERAWPFFYEAVEVRKQTAGLTRKEKTREKNQSL